MFVGITIISIKTYREEPNNRLLIVGLLYKALASLGLSSALISVILRALVVSNSLPVAIPVAVYYVLFLMFVGYYRYEIALYHAKARILTQIEPIPNKV